MNSIFSSVLFLAFILVITHGFQLLKQPYEFKVDYENDQFLKDGEPFRYVSGSFHYFRVPRPYWQDRLRKYRAAGLNAVSLYVEWSRHEPRPGVFDFTGENDLEHVIKLAQQEDLLVILRPGPYICAERDLGGYPIWLLHKKPKMLLRTNDKTHTKYVKMWLDTLLPRMQPFLYGNGGPIIMVQVENEYGSYGICDRNYTLWLRDVFDKHIGKKAVLFTTDGAGTSYLKCGPIPGVFTTVDFGTGSKAAHAFKYLRDVQPHGPLVNSEFYPGWLTKWGDESVKRVDTNKLVKATTDLLTANASFNFYVFHGGTNFGFTSGANYDSSPNTSFRPQITSYDYDAPISEAGELTEKYFAIKSVLSKVMEVPSLEIKNSTNYNYSSVSLKPTVSLFDSQAGISYGMFKYPKTFEELELYTGFMLYETILPPTFPGSGVLLAKNIHDRAHVFLNEKLVGTLDRNGSHFQVKISGYPNSPLGLLVENQGHINYGYMSDLKGLTENVTMNREVLVDWIHIGFPLQNVSHIVNITPVTGVNLPAFYTGKFQLSAPPGDTFVDMSRWGKGIVYINGHNLGRYWSTKGPQQSLYLPGLYLKESPAYNDIVVLELEKEHRRRLVSFVDRPVLS